MMCMVCRHNGYIMEKEKSGFDVFWGSNRFGPYQDPTKFRENEKLRGRGPFLWFIVGTVRGPKIVFLGVRITKRRVSILMGQNNSV